MYLAALGRTKMCIRDRAMTFPYSTGQIPIYYNRRKSGRGHQGFYKDITSAVSYTHLDVYKRQVYILF